MFGWGTSRGTRALSDCRWRCLLLHATVVLHVGQGLWGDLNYINHDLLKGHIKTLNGHQLMSDWQLVLNLSVCYPILSTTTLFALCSFFFFKRKHGFRLRPLTVGEIKVLRAPGEIQCTSGFCREVKVDEGTLMASHL